MLIQISENITAQTRKKSHQVYNTVSDLLVEGISSHKESKMTTVLTNRQNLGELMMFN